MKKFKALLMAFIMVFSFSTVTAFASNGANGDTGSGISNVVDTQVISVVLPTSKNFEFTLDPQGLLGIPKGESRPLTHTDVLNAAGKISFPSDYAPIILNKSSTDIALGVQFDIVFTATDGIIPKTSSSDALNATDNSVFLATLLSTANKQNTDKSNATDFATAEIVPMTGTATAEHLLFVLGKAQYIMTDTGTGHKYILNPSVTNNANGTRFRLTGSLSKTADWSEFAGADATKNIGISVKYGIDIATTTQKSTVTSLASSSYGYGGVVSGAVITGFPGLTKAITVSKSATGGLEMPFFYSGDIFLYWEGYENGANADFPGFIFGFSDGSNPQLTAGHPLYFTFANNTLTLTEAMLKLYRDAAVGTYPLHIWPMSDANTGPEHKITITVTN